MRPYYFYIDEAGHIQNHSNVFVNGCIRTDAPLELEERLDKFWKDLEDNIYFMETLQQIKSQGLHAAENHPDVRAKFYSMLSLMNFRAFFVIFNKKTSWFLEQQLKHGMEEIYTLTLKTLIGGRLFTKDRKLIFNFEELKFLKTSQQKVLDNFFMSYLGTANFEYNVVSKECKLMALTDYMNYIFYKLLETPKKQEPRFMQNFNLVEPKIALIHFLHNGEFLNRKKEISVIKISDIYIGSQ